MASAAVALVLTGLLLVALPSGGSPLLAVPVFLVVHLWRLPLSCGGSTGAHAEAAPAAGT